MKELAALFDMLKEFGYTEEQLSQLSIDEGITLIKKIRYEVAVIEEERLSGE